MPLPDGPRVSDRTASIVEVKTVVRCRDYGASYDFYHRLLGFPITETWDEPGDRGCIFSPTGDPSAGAIEIYDMTEADPRYDPAFSQRFTNDKIDMQLRTPDLDSWVIRLRGRWFFTEPEITPWGHRWIKLRDPDNLQIAIYEVLAVNDPSAREFPD